MDRSRMRSAAISCVIACGAMVAGPATLGSAVASADGIFGIDILDIFGDDKKSKLHHVGVEVGVAGRAPNLAVVPTVPRTRSVVIRAEHPASVPAAPAAPALVPTVPRTRSVVIRAEPPASVPAAPAAPALVPTVPRTRSVVIDAERPASVPAAPAAPAPVFVPPVVPPPVVVPLGPAPAPSASAPLPSPAAPPLPVIQQPRTNVQPAPADSLSPEAESFRPGYPDYLRGADVGVLLAVALPGLAGLLALTAGGVVLGYRQARTGQAAIVRTEIARFLR